MLNIPCSAVIRFQRQDRRGQRIECLIVGILSKECVLNDQQWSRIPHDLLERLKTAAGPYDGKDNDEFRYTRSKTVWLRDEDYAALKAAVLPMHNLPDTPITQKDGVK